MLEICTQVCSTYISHSKLSPQCEILYFLSFSVKQKLNLSIFLNLSYFLCIGPFLPQGRREGDGTYKAETSILQKLGKINLNDILVYLEIGAYSNYHQRDLMEQLLKTDAKTHSQRDRVLVILWKYGRKDCGARSVKDFTRKAKMSIKLRSWGSETLNWQQDVHMGLNYAFCIHVKIV